MRPGRTRLGIGAFLADPRRWAPGPRLGLLTNQAALTGDGRPTLEAPRVDASEMPGSDAPDAGRPWHEPVAA